MNRHRSEARLRAPRAVLAALLAGAASMAAPPARANESPASASAPVPGRAEGTALQRYGEMLARPLFSPTRRPQTVRGEAVETVTADLPVLRGVVIAPGRRIALVEYGNPPKPQRATEGARIGALTVEKIEPDRIALRLAGGRTAVVRLSPKRAQGTDAGSAPISVPLPNATDPSWGGAEALLPAAAASPVVSRRPRPGSS